MRRHTAQNSSLVRAKRKIAACALARYDKNHAVADSMMVMQEAFQLCMGFRLPHAMKVDPAFGIRRSPRKLFQSLLLQRSQRFDCWFGRRRDDGRRGTGPRWRTGLRDCGDGEGFAEQRPHMTRDRTPQLELVPGQAASCGCFPLDCVHGWLQPLGIITNKSTA